MDEYYLARAETDKKFGVPEQKKFPLPDASHVRSAIKFFNYVDPKYEKQLAKAILARAKEYGVDISEMDIGDNNRFKKYLPNELKHHGILGQKWGKRNGPPYPLDEEDHSSNEKKEGWKKSLDGKNEDLYDRKRKLVLSDKQKKYLKIGLAVAGTALLAYGGYKLYTKTIPPYYKNLGKKNVDFIKNSGKFDYLDEGLKYGNVDNVLQSSFISDKAIEISEKTGLSLKDKLSTPLEDIETLRNSRKPGDPHYDNDCGPLAINFLLRRLGLDVVSTPMDESQLGGLSFSELGRYVKGLSSASEDVQISSGKSQQAYIDEIKSIISKQCGSDKDCVGLIALDLPFGSTGHFTTWYTENGTIKFDDIQSNSQLINRVNYSKMRRIRVARMDNLEIKTNNLLGSKVDSDIRQITKNR